LLQHEESPIALLNNPARAYDLFAYPIVPHGRKITSVPHWVARGGADLAKATHYDVRDGRF
ncbi:MAG: epimerase, partial [Geminicoccaceae bacterium]|nr:epimerase [Geminicoccaceae bacterium]